MKDINKNHVPDPLSKQPLAKGGHHQISRINLAIQGNTRSHALNMLVREPLSVDVVMSDSIAELEKLAEMRDYLRSHNVPVIPTYRIDKKTNSIYMTDLTCGGKYLVHSTTSLRSHMTEIAPMNVSAKQFLEPLKELAKKISDAQCKLIQTDAVFLKIDPSAKEIDFLIGDYKYVQRTDNESSGKLLKWNFRIMLHLLKRACFDLGLADEEAISKMNDRLE